MMSESKFYKLKDDTEIHCQIKEVDSPIWLICTHGVGEHLGRHQHLNNLFGRDFNMFQYDLRGHGKSSGRRAYVDNFNQFYEDLHELINMLKEEYRLKRYVLFGHSLGGLITSGFVQGLTKDQLYPESIFLSSPAVGIPGAKGIISAYTPLSIIEKLQALPSVALDGLVDLKNLSHNKNVYKDYVEDTFNCLKIHSNLLFEMIKEMRNVFNRPLRVNCPCYCAYGTEDKIVDPDAIQTYFTTIERSVLLKKYHGAYHEIHNESEKYRRDYFDFLRSSLLEALYHN